MKSFKLINNLAGWGVLLISFIIYMLTLEPSVSFWDCGEFIASSYKLQIGHPPGSPLFMIITHVVSLFASSQAKVAFMINTFSAFASGATIMFLYWTIVMFSEKILENNSTKKNQILILAAGVIGSLTFAFTDSFWFSAVEAEVYAFSSFITAVVFWAILKWERVVDEKYSNRWIILIAYLVGLSIGVHLLNLLAIPAVVLIWYFKKYKTTAKGIVYTILGSGAIIAFIMWGIIQGIPTIAQKFEILFVNSFGLPYNSGLIFIIILILALAVGLFVYSQRNKKVILNMFIVSFLLIIMGFSSYTVVLIRSKANPPMNENNPENTYTLMKYLNRSQFGKTPFFFGYYFNSNALVLKKREYEYFPKNGKYVKLEDQPEYVSKFKTIFPRMYSSHENHINGYKMWGKIKGKPYTINGKTEYIPTFAENLRFFFSYQLNYMYFRYFFWNFSGRQNDNLGKGDIYNGNWITGIGFLDKARLGHNGKQPASMANPKTMNRYYMLPFLLGLIGLFFHFRKSKKDFWVVMLLFFMTGIAIVIYLNQTPYQIRERDYAYDGSFYAFAIWIGLGVLGLYKLIDKYIKKNAIIVAIVIGTIIPVLVLAENYDDHDRSGRYFAKDFGKNYLNSCDKNAILFVYGDNDTFPLWYVQDVENVRPDVRICNANLLNSDWYIDQMKCKIYNSDPLPISMGHDKYEHDVRNNIVVSDNLKTPIELSKLMGFMLSDDLHSKLKNQEGTLFNFTPTKTIKITVDKQKVLSTKTVSPNKASLIEDSIIFDISSHYLTKSDLAFLDILANNNWDRPIYLDPNMVGTSNLNLDKYLQLEGFAYRLVPIKNQGIEPGVNTDLLYNRLMNQFSWGNIGDKRVFVDENVKKITEIIQIKNTFYLLAERLVSEGKNEKAKQAIEKLYSILPIGMFSTSYYDIYIATVWYKLSDFSNGDKLMRTVASECFEKIDYYRSFGSDYLQNSQREVNSEISILKELTRMSGFSSRTELINEINGKLSLITGNGSM